jgi:hypothetical protein
MRQKNEKSIFKTLLKLTNISTSSFSIYKFLNLEMEKNLVLLRSLHEYIQRAFLSDNCLMAEFLYAGKKDGRRNRIVIPGFGNTVPFICIYSTMHCVRYTQRQIDFFCPIITCVSLGGQHFCVPLLWRGPVRPPISHPTWEPQGCPRDQLIRPVISAVVSCFSLAIYSTSFRRIFREKSATSSFSGHMKLQLLMCQICQIVMEERGDQSNVFFALLLDCREIRLRRGSGRCSNFPPSAHIYLPSNISRWYL